MQEEKLEFKQWVGKQLRTDDFSVQALRNDASFRSYFRIKQCDFSYVLMNAPPEKEKTDQFVAIANAWHAQALPVPQVLGWDKVRGYVLLSDFGDTLLLDIINEANVDKAYGCAMALLQRLQTCSTEGLPVFDEAYMRVELHLFQEWFCTRWLGLTLSETEQRQWESVNQILVANAVVQPAVLMHRDYHSRNLMVLPSSPTMALGVIDFQDAMIGPVTYDLVSILKDCYICWPRARVREWAKQYYDAIRGRYAPSVEWETFLQWFDWMGLQRHLKVLGIFARLKVRDNKPHYIRDLPRVLDYVLEVTRHYNTFAPFHAWLQETILPRFEVVWRGDV